MDLKENHIVELKNGELHKVTYVEEMVQGYYEDDFVVQLDNGEWYRMNGTHSYEDNDEKDIVEILGMEVGCDDREWELDTEALMKDYNKSLGRL